jgi:hypothetical protein
MLLAEPQAVYVPKSSAMERTFKPTYSDKLPSPTVLTEEEWMEMDDKEQQALYHKVGPVRKMSDVQELDMSTYVEMLGNLERELTDTAGTNEYDIRKIMERIKTVLRLTSNYDQKFFDGFRSAPALRSVSDHMNALVKKYTQETEEPTKNPGYENRAEQVNTRRDRRKYSKAEFRDDLGALLQQLQDVSAV